MKRLIVLLLAFSIVAAADRRTWADKSDEKPKDAKKDEKKDDKKDDKKEDEKPKIEVKLSDEQKKELEKLSGTFTVTTLERDGKKESAEDLKKMKVVQKGSDWTFHLGEDMTQGKDAPILGTTPKAIDSTYTQTTSPLERGKTIKGIYKIEGDTITYCWARSDKDRPTAFETKADSGLTLFVLKRVEEKKDKPKDKEKDKE